MSFGGFDFALSHGSVVEPLQPLKDADEMQAKVRVLATDRIQSDVQILEGFVRPQQLQLFKVVYVVVVEIELLQVRQMLQALESDEGVAGEIERAQIDEPLQRVAEMRDLLLERAVKSESADVGERCAGAALEVDSLDDPILRRPDPGRFRNHLESEKRRANLKLKWREGRRRVEEEEV